MQGLWHHNLTLLEVDQHSGFESGGDEVVELGVESLVCCTFESVDEFETFWVVQADEEDSGVREALQELSSWICVVQGLSIAEWRPPIVPEQAMLNFFEAVVDSGYVIEE